MFYARSLLLPSDLLTESGEARWQFFSTGEPPLQAGCSLKGSCGLECSGCSRNGNPATYFLGPTQVGGWGWAHPHHPVNRRGGRKTNGPVRFSVRVFQESLGSICQHLDEEICFEPSCWSARVVMHHSYRRYDDGTRRSRVGSTNYSNSIPVSEFVTSCSS